MVLFTNGNVGHCGGKAPKWRNGRRSRFRIYALNEVGVQVPFWVMRYLYCLELSFRARDVKAVRKWVEKYANFGRRSGLFNLYFSSLHASMDRLEFIQRSPHAQTKYGFHGGVTFIIQRVYCYTSETQHVSCLCEMLLKQFLLYNLTMQRC